MNLVKKCKTENCKNKAAKQRNYCHACTNRKARKRHPLEYMYYAWHNNAVRRGKEFTVTINEFKQFCIETGYDQKKGIHADCFSIDRIDATKGYHVWNIRSITVSDNSKRARGVVLEMDGEFRMIEEECPF